MTTTPYRIPARSDPDLAGIAKRYDRDDVAGQIGRLAGLGPDRLERNRRDAAHAALACVAYDKAMRTRCSTSEDETIVDLLTDLHHLADELGLDIDQLWMTAERNYTEEIEG